MSAVDEEVKFSLKVMINREKTKVLFAEVDSDFADALLSFLTLPLGSIVRIFEKHYGDHETVPILGSLNSLRKGLANLNDVHFWTKEGKMMLLNPISLFQDEYRKLKLNIDHNSDQSIKYYVCEDMDCYRDMSSNVRMYYDTSKCRCGRLMKREIGVKDSNDQARDDGVFTRKPVSFAISDNLQMVPNAGSIISNLHNFGITDLDGSEQITVTLGLNEIMDLLKGSLVSNTPLTDLILNKVQKSKAGAVVHKMDEILTSNSNKITVQVVVHKSTNKLLFAIAKEKFIDFLFGLLTIPLGGVLHLSGSNTCLGSIHNLYMIIHNMSGDEYLKTKDMKSMLLKLELPPMYLSKNQIFPLVERETPSWCHHPHMDGNVEFFRSYKKYKKDCLVSFEDPKGDEGSYVKGPATFMVADDLTVTPLSMMSSVSILNGLKIPLSDVEEIECEIGLEEAVNILRASITSTSALTNGLMINRSVMKQPKKEK